MNIWFRILGLAAMAIMAKTPLAAQKIRIDTAYFNEEGHQVIKSDDVFTYEVRPLDQNKKIHGILGKFTRSGQLIEATEYKEGEKNGAYEKFNVEGKVVVHGDFKRGIKIGYWTTLDNDGNILSLEEYDKKGRLINTRVNEYLSDSTQSGGGYFNQLEVKKPQFVDGVNGWNLFLRKKLRYPTEARRFGYQGDVSVSFIVLSDGKVVDPRITNSPYRSLSREALRILRVSPNWIPGTIDGKPVDAEIKLKIRFRLR